MTRCLTCGGQSIGHDCHTEGLQSSADCSRRTQSYMLRHTLAVGLTNASTWTQRMKPGMRRRPRDPSPSGSLSTAISAAAEPVVPIAALQLCVHASGDWLAVPEWASALMSLGGRLHAAEASIDLPMTLVASVPSRQLAAGFIAAGLTKAILSRSGQESGDGHTERLSRLAPGTPVTVMKDDKPVPCRILSVDLNQPLGIRVTAYLGRRRGEEIWRYGPSDAWRIKAELTGEAHDGHAHGTRLRRAKFLRKCLGNEQVQRLTTLDKVCYLIAGNRTALAQEARSLQLRLADADGKWLEGLLAHLIRPRCLLAEGQHFVCDFVSAPAPPRKRPTADQESNFVIFDGARAWLTSRHKWPSAHWCILLDRSDSHTEAAAIALTQLSQTKRAGELAPDLAEGLPIGIDVGGFVRAG
jgi:hypothetical protein